MNKKFAFLCILKRLIEIGKHCLLTLLLTMSVNDDLKRCVEKLIMFVWGLLIKQKELLKVKMTKSSRVEFFFIVLFASGLVCSIQV
jgi:hypothetical protein